MLTYRAADGHRNLHDIFIELRYQLVVIGNRRPAKCGEKSSRRNDP